MKSRSLSGVSLGRGTLSGVTASANAGVGLALLPPQASSCLGRFEVAGDEKSQFKA